MRIKEGFKGERAVVIPPVTVQKMQEHPVASSLYITDIGYYPHACHHHRRRESPIGEHVLIYCVAGSGYYILNGARHGVGPNRCFILPANECHEYGASETDPWTIYWIHFSGTLADGYARQAEGVMNVDSSDCSRIASRKEMFEEMLTAMSRWYEPGQSEYACSMLHHFLGTLIYLDSYRKDQTAESEIVESALHFMEENLERQLRVEEIAAYCGMSPSYFSAIFKSRTGYSPIAYLNKMRIRHACMLIDHTDMHINQICHKVGIPDPYYFSRLFKLHQGVSPRIFRSR